MNRELLLEGEGWSYEREEKGRESDHGRLLFCRGLGNYEHHERRARPSTSTARLSYILLNGFDESLWKDIFTFTRQKMMFRYGY